MKLLKLSAVAALACLLTTSANADEEKSKRDLQDNYQEVYNVVPSSVDNLSDAFTKGMFYGRLRMNTFKWDWKASDNATNQDNTALGLGGSMIYKTAPLYGVSATAGLYYSDSPFEGTRENTSNIKYGKAGKDTVSRYDVINSGNYSLAVLGQAYLQYDISKTTFKAGRQIFESFLTASNDSKMIPNTFEGLSFESKDLPKTTLKGAFFTAQKLRDHSTFHDVITYNDSVAGTNNGKYNGNDDSGAHQGLSYSNFTTAHKDVNHKLIVLQATNKTIENLTLDVNYNAVPDVVSSLMGEINYKIALPNGYNLTPGARYMAQFDNGGGNIGGANLGGTFGRDKGTITNKKGYNNVHSLNSGVGMARLVLDKGPMKLQVGYSAVADEADIVAPWRGFPTGGYTRAMAQNNWFANTKTTDLEGSFDFGKADIVKGLSTSVRYAIQDFDNAKQAAGVQADSNILEVNFRQKIAKGLDARVRMGFVSAKDRTALAPSLPNKNADSYNEYRFELNYLF